MYVHLNTQQSMHILPNMFMGYLIDSNYFKWPVSMLVLEGVCMWLGFFACTYYVWRIKVFI